MIYYVLFFTFGLIFGSFFNVLIYRIPIKKSISFPPSHCPSCGAEIKFYDNVPLLSYIFLWGKCRSCKTRISPLYPSIELMTGLMFISVYHMSGLTLSALAYIIGFSFMIVLSGIDLKYKEVNVFSLFIPAFIFGVVHILKYFNIFSHQVIGYPISGISEAGFGMGLGVLFFLLIRFIGSKILKKEAMGEADIYMAGLMGIMLGYKIFFYSIIIAGTAGIVFYFIFLRKSSDKEIPFFPYLSIGAYGAYMLNEIIKSVFIP